MAAALNENLIREVVEEVLGRLGKTESKKQKAESPDCNCHKNPNGAVSGQFGVFQDANSACDA